jgi:7,8-dihydropterin-6-yl-methyl-4-(beta-D-ribofuranosyl)aminobenzene 5'-phosphate synthase
MTVKILYDNQAVEGFRSGWGLSILINDTILFDTGAKARRLLTNMRNFGISFERIQYVVLSHADWDHVGGIAVLKHVGAVDVFVPSSFSKAIRRKIEKVNKNARIIDVLETIETNKDFMVTSELEGSGKREISAVIRVPKGLVLLVGCSHPGLDRIVAEVSRLGKIHAVIGGFHGFTNLETLASIPLIIPTHCTKRKNEIRNRYPDRTRFVAAGEELNIE